MEESDQIENLAIVLPDAGTLLPCLMTTMHWSFFLLNEKKDVSFFFIWWWIIWNLLMWAIESSFFLDLDNQVPE